MTLRRPPSSLILALLCGSSACASKPEKKPPPPGASEHWSYRGQDSPEHWGSLNPEYADCGKGLFQSPINLTEVAKRGSAPLSISYQKDHLRVVNNGHTVQMNHEPGSWLRVGDKGYTLRQMHFHNPSEHTVEGEHFPLEIHLVHDDGDGNYAVVAVFVEATDTKNVAIDPVWHDFPQKAGEVHERNDVVFDATAFLPKDLTHFQYAGSLTTPPCTESVTWNVVEAPLKLSHEQIRQFTRLYQANARPVQPRPDWCLGTIGPDGAMHH